LRSEITVYAQSRITAKEGLGGVPKCGPLTDVDPADLLKLTAFWRFLLHPRPTGWPKKVSHYQESSFHVSIKNRHCGYISHQF